MEKVELRTFGMGDVVFKQGDKGTEMYEVISGLVGIYINYGKENEKCLVELGAGKYFGEMAVIDDMPRSATAVAFKESELACIKQSAFEEYIKENPAVAISMMSNLSTRLRSLTGDYVEVCKTMSEAIAEGMSSKKEGLWSKMKKYAAEYDKLANEAFVKSGYDAYYVMDHFSMYY